MQNTIIFNDNHLGALIHFRREVIESFVSKGYEVILVAPVQKSDLTNLPAGVKYVPVDMNRTSIGINDSFKYLFQLYMIIKNNKPLIVFNFTIKPILFGGIICKMLGIKSVAFFAGISNKLSNLRNNFRGRIIEKSLRKILKWNYKAIFLNETDVEFIRLKRLLPISKIVLFEGGEGVNVNKYSPVDGSENERFKVVMVSRVLKTKGYNEFARAAKRLKNENTAIDLFLAGGLDESHPEGISLRQINKDCGNGEFTYMGHIRNLPEFLKNADCVVLPSYYNEGMNRSLMEALSMGIPIITTDNRGCKELVKNGETGFIIPARNSEALYNAIKEMYNLTSQERMSFRTKSREYALQRFDIKNVISKYLKIIDSVI